MLEIVRTKYGIPIRDIFFSPSPSEARSAPTISFFIQAAIPANGFYPVKTQVIDLRADSGALFSNISKGARYKIKRAEREGIIPEFIDVPSEEQIRQFCGFFNIFARQKDLAKTNHKKLRALRSEGSLVLSSVQDSCGRALVRHAYVADRDSQRLRLLYSASHFRGSDDTEERNMIGRANRLLHWYEIQESKQRGYHTYDLGGIPIDESDPAKNAIAQFKREFGGSEVTEYNGFHSDNPLLRRALPVLRGLVS